MSFEDKCIKSRDTAIICYKQKDYDSCINRYYYSFYQKLLSIFDSNQGEIELDDINDIGSHQKTFNSFVTNLYEPLIIGEKPRERISLITKIRSTYRDFKKLRKKADYEGEALSVDKANKAKQYYTQLSNILSKFG